jgi:hypothetical protein
LLFFSNFGLNDVYRLFKAGTFSFEKSMELMLLMGPIFRVHETWLKEKTKDDAYRQKF